MLAILALLSGMLATDSARHAAKGEWNTDMLAFYIGRCLDNRGQNPCCDKLSCTAMFVAQLSSVMFLQ